MIIHGHATRENTSRTYSSWAAMIQRCTNKNMENYPFYGGIGITVCDRWFSFENFLADMGERPSVCTLDRWPNYSGNYEPGNCRWATHKQQCRNRKSSRPVIRSDGKKYPSMGDAAEDVDGKKGGIFDTCRGYQKTYKGYGWAYDLC